MKFRHLASIMLLSVFYSIPLPAQYDDGRIEVGLVLSGGGARGGAHVGVLKVLEALNLQVDYIVGTSMGAIIGGFYAAGYSADEIERLLVEVDWNRALTANPASDQPDAPKTAARCGGSVHLIVGRSTTVVVVMQHKGPRFCPTRTHREHQSRWQQQTT